MRKRIQKQYGKECRLLFKHSRKLLIKHENKLKDYEKEQVNAILSLSSEMLYAYILKERFYKIMESNDRETAKKLMSDWILFAQNSKIPEYGEITIIHKIILLNFSI